MIEAMAGEIMLDCLAISRALRLIGLRRRHRSVWTANSAAQASAPNPARSACHVRGVINAALPSIMVLVVAERELRRFEAANLLGVPVNAILKRLKDSQPDNFVLILGGKLAIYHGVNLSV